MVEKEAARAPAEVGKVHTAYEQQWVVVVFRPWAVIVSDYLG